MYSLNTEVLCKAGRLVRWSGIALFTVGRLGVPLFIFLTGYLMLAHTYQTKDILYLWKKVLGMLVATEVWIIFYYFFSLWRKKEDFSLSILIFQMLFLKSSSGPHLWYMPIILGLYIFIPFVANVINETDKKILSYLMIVIVIYLFVPPILNVFRLVSGEEMLYKQLNFSFAGGEYGILLIIGWMIKKKYFEQIRSIHYILLGVGGYLLTVILELYAYRHGVSYNVWYDSLTLLVTSFSIFNLFLKVKKFKGGVFSSDGLAKCHLRFTCAMKQ